MLELKNEGTCQGRLREEQTGFRSGRSCADQIATLRIIIEQSIEFQTSLHLNFVDFEKVFDSIDHLVLWTLLRHYWAAREIHQNDPTFLQELQMPSDSWGIPYRVI